MDHPRDYTADSPAGVHTPAGLSCAAQRLARLPGPRGGDLRAAPDAEVSEERSYATEKKWSARQSIHFVFVMSVVLWALIILGVRQIF